MFTITISLYPILRIYKSIIPFLDLAEFIMIFVLLLLLLRQNRKLLSKNKGYNLFVFLFIASILTFTTILLHEYSLFSMISRFSRTIFYFMLIIISINIIDWKLLKKFVIFLSILSASLLLVQVTLYYTTGYVFKPYIPFLDLTIELIPTLVSRGTFRPASLFTEPAHFSYFMIYGLLFLLNNLQLTKRNIMLSIVFTISIFLSNSTTGIMISMVIWIFMVLSNLKRSGRITSKHVSIIVTILLMIIVFINFFDNSSSYTFSKMIQALSGENARIDSNWSQLERLNIVQGIIGVGFGNEDYYYLYRFNTEFGYSNTIGFLISNVGFIGLIVYYSTIINFYYKVNKENRIYISVFLILTTISNPITSIYGILLLAKGLSLDKNIKNGVKNELREPKITG